MKSSLALWIVGLLVLLAACCHAQEDGEAVCIVKFIHLLPGGSPVDVRVGEQLVAVNVAFQRSQISQANVPCGPQNVQLFPTANETSFRSENFALAGGENVYNYIVFGGEVRAPADTNIFLLSHEAVLMPTATSEQANIAFWHYAPVVRLDQLQLDVLNGEEVQLTSLANFQQRTNYQVVPNAESLTFRLTNLELEELASVDRSLAGIRGGAGTVFAIGQNITEIFIESDPAVTGSGPTDGGEESSSGSFTPPPPPPPSEESSSSFGNVDGSSLGSSSSESAVSSATSLVPFFFL